MPVFICWGAPSPASPIPQCLQSIAKCRFEFGRDHIGHRGWLSCQGGGMAAPHHLWSGGVASASSPDEGQIAHQAAGPRPHRGLSPHDLSQSTASRASICITHILDWAVRSTLGEDTRGSRGSPLITLPEQSLRSLPGGVVDPASPKGHPSLANLREASHPHLGIVWGRQFGGSSWPSDHEGLNPSAARAIISMSRLLESKQVPMLYFIATIQRCISAMWHEANR